jgi:iron complex outermembrane receptor protein
VDEVTTSGVELILQQDNVFDLNTDIRFNLAYTDSEITENSADPSVEGNVFPRMPEWRANLLATWHLHPQWDSSLGLRYASDSYGRLDNEDDGEEVYGAQDDYLFVDLKANYRITDRAKLSIGVDNLTDEVAFVAHPWPQRTYYVQGSIDF